MAIPCCPPSPVWAPTTICAARWPTRSTRTGLPARIFEANDTRDYNLVSVGFFVRFLFRAATFNSHRPHRHLPGRRTASVHGAVDSQLRIVLRQATGGERDVASGDDYFGATRWQGMYGGYAEPAGNTNCSGS